LRRSVTFALTLLGLFDSLYLLWVYASPSHAMVCLGSGCDEVRASRFAHLFGMPTPIYGVAMYGLLALLLLLEPLLADATASLVRGLVTIISALGVAASIVLSGIEGFVIHAWCAWCVVSAVVITLIFLLSLTFRRSRIDDHAQSRKILIDHALILVIGIAIGFQAFRWLQRRAEAQVQAAPPTAAALAQNLVRPDSHATGNPQAAVTLVEFGDLQCPSCAAADPELRELRKQYADRVRFVFRQFPLPQVHPYAQKAAEASECAAQQGKFWEALERFYKANGDLQESSLRRYAGEIGLDVPKFNQCLAGGNTRSIIQRDTDDGHALGVRGTPTFFLGDQRIVGAPEMSKFQAYLNTALAAAPSTQASAAGSNPFLNVAGNSIDCSEDAPKGPEPNMIHTSEAEKLFRDGAQFVDVRSADDFAKTHIQGAGNIPMLEAPRRADELPKNKTIVLYEAGSGGSNDTCAASRAVGRVLLGHGFKVLVYQDGLTGWEKKGLPISR
jgi:protein-disulfide isomerase/rhodanese-related sulfurtransferase/uncharacterized membrane protein